MHPDADDNFKQFANAVRQHQCLEMYLAANKAWTAYEQKKGMKPVLAKRYFLTHLFFIAL
jgi:hypothetical protein